MVQLPLGNLIAFKAVDTVGNYLKIIIIMKPFLITGNGERLLV